MLNPLKETSIARLFVAAFGVAAIVLAGSCFALRAGAQSGAAEAGTGGPPPSSVGVFPLAQVKRGMKGTAWTVFEGTVPEPMDVEILGLLRGARGPGRDLILARLHGAKPEYTGVVAGMSGSPVYVEGKLLGALSYRIGQFAKDPIAGITPIEQMLEVRDIPVGGSSEVASSAIPLAIPHLTRSAASDVGHPGASLPFSEGDGTSFRVMETPLLMSGFVPEAIALWKERLAGTGLDLVSAGGMGGQSEESGQTGSSRPMVPGAAVSLQLVRGDMEIAATCTVTYVDPKQLLACGHPVMQSGPVSIPMTESEVVATLASPLNAFKIVNTGRTIGAFTEDRDAAIRGEFGVQARMIPVSMEVKDAVKTVTRKVEIVDLPAITASGLLVSVYQTLLETNQSSARTTYHVTGEILLKGEAPVPVDAWGAPGEQMNAQLAAALGVWDGFNRLYGNGARVEPVESVRLHVEVIPEDRRMELESVRLISSSIVHAGDTVVVEATLRPWEKPARNVRIPFTIPGRLGAGSLRVLVGSAAGLDRTLDAARPAGKQGGVEAVSARIRGLHAADRLYVSLLLPEAQASVEGRTLDSFPLSMANTMESQRSGTEVGLHGESIVVAAQTEAGGVLSGQQLLTLHVEGGGGLH